MPEKGDSTRNIIELKQISFTYNNGEKGNSVTDISLSIGAGVVVLLCGESGYGKRRLQD